MCIRDSLKLNPRRVEFKERSALKIRCVGLGRFLISPRQGRPVPACYKCKNSTRRGRSCFFGSLNSSRKINLHRNNSYTTCEQQHNALILTSSTRVALTWILCQCWKKKKREPSEQLFRLHRTDLEHQSNSSALEAGL